MFLCLLPFPLLSALPRSSGSFVIFPFSVCPLCLPLWLLSSSLRCSINISRCFFFFFFFFSTVGFTGVVLSRACMCVCMSARAFLSTIKRDKSMAQCSRFTATYICTYTCIAEHACPARKLIARNGVFPLMPRVVVSLFFIFFFKTMISRRRKG